MWDSLSAILRILLNTDEKAHQKQIKKNLVVLICFFNFYIVFQVKQGYCAISF
jgi:hypothetical protein